MIHKMHTVYIQYIDMMSKSKLNCVALKLSKNFIEVTVILNH